MEYFSVGPFILSAASHQELKRWREVHAYVSQPLVVDASSAGIVNRCLNTWHKTHLQVTLGACWILLFCSELLFWCSHRAWAFPGKLPQQFCSSCQLIRTVKSEKNKKLVEISSWICAFSKLTTGSLASGLTVDHTKNKTKHQGAHESLKKSSGNATEYCFSSFS